MAQHTPGPWEVSPLHLQHGMCDNDGGVPIMAGSGDDRCRIGTAGLTIQVKRGTGHKAADPVRDANARLIVAAPDLLAFAEHVREAVKLNAADMSPVVATYLDQIAVAAIARAEGRSDG